MKRPRTILMTADTIGGVWTYVLELSRGLAAHGIQVMLATMGAPLSKEQRVESASIENLKVFESHFRLEWMPEPWEEVDRAGEWLQWLNRELRPDVVHLNGYVHGSLPWSVPVLIVAHSCVLSWWQAVKGERAPTKWDEYQHRVRNGLQGASMVIAPTRAMLQVLPKHYELSKLNNARVIPNARDPQLFAPAVKESFIFAAGRLGDEAKNIATLGKAAEGLLWPVMVAGNRQDASGKQMLPLNVKDLGFLATTELADRLGRAPIYALPARYEPFGLSVLEAALAGCALVLGDIPSLRELWGKAAIFVPPNDVCNLRGVLRELIEDPVRRVAFGQAARKRGLKFTPARSSTAYRRAYEDLLNRA